MAAPFIAGAALLARGIVSAGKYLGKKAVAGLPLVTKAELTLYGSDAKAPSRKNKNKSIFDKGNMK